MEPSAQFKDDEDKTLPTKSATQKSPTSILSSIASPGIADKLIIRQDANQQLQFLVKYELMTDPSGRKCTKARLCKLCCQIEKREQKDTMCYCISDGVKSSLCNDPNRDCFKQHAPRIKLSTRSSSDLYSEV
jgi:hypothetical protein